MGFLAFLLFVPRFPRPPPLQICGGALFSYVTRSQRFRQSASRWGCFFLLFFSSSVYFLLIFNTSFVHFSQFSFGFSFWFSFVYSLCIPCFDVYIMEKPAAVLQAVVIVVVMITALLRRRPQVFIKRKLNPSGQEKNKGCKYPFHVYTFIENLFRTQSSILGLWQIESVILVKQDYQIGYYKINAVLFLA